MLDAHVFAFGIFTDDDQVNTGIASGNPWQVLDGTEICEQFVLFAQRYVDAGEAAADGSRGRAFESDARAFNGLICLAWNVFLVLDEGFRAHFERFPIDLHAAGIEDAARGSGY